MVVMVVPVVPESLSVRTAVPKMPVVDVVVWVAWEGQAFGHVGVLNVKVETLEVG